MAAKLMKKLDQYPTLYKLHDIDMERLEKNKGLRIS